MQISVTHDLHKITKYLNNLQRQQIPFAASQAINDTAKDAQNALKVQATKKLDRPTRQTVNSFRVKYSNKRKLVGEVFILPWAYDYLKYQIEGGTRTTNRKRGTGIPTTNARLNQYGNIPNRKKGLIKKKTQFAATIRGVSGIWERVGRGGQQVKLVVLFEKQVQYKARFPFHKIVQGVVKNKFIKHFDQRMRAALATAR